MANIFSILNRYLFFPFLSASYYLVFYVLPRALLTAATASLLGIYFFQRKLIYVPSYPAESRRQVWKPNRFGMEKFIEVFFPSPLLSPGQRGASEVADGGGKTAARLLLHGYFIPASLNESSTTSFESASSSSPSSPSTVKAPTLLYFHANAGNMGHRLPVIAMMKRYLPHLNVFIFSYRGYGLSEGEPSQWGFEEDAFSAYQLLTGSSDLKSNNGEEELNLSMEVEQDNLLGNNGMEGEQIRSRIRSMVDPKSIILYGQSIGGAVAISLYHRLVSSSNAPVPTLIVENTFTRLPDLVPLVMPFLTPFKFLVWDTWESERKLRDLMKNQVQSELSPPTSPVTSSTEKGKPILFLSGLKDELIPSHMMDRLFVSITNPSSSVVDTPPPATGQSVQLIKAFKTGKCWLARFLKGTHNDTFLQPGYMEVLRDFINEMFQVNPSKQPLRTEKL